MAVSPNFKEETGKQYGRLRVTERAPNQAKTRKAQWYANCECGTITVVLGKNLRSGNTRSCGCLRKDHPGGTPPHHARAHLTHGHRANGKQSATYTTWKDMIKRCNNPNETAYKYYGARGIKVCKRWHRFENFLADMGERHAGKTIDRIDPAGNYEPGNCRWATPKEQARNKCANVERSARVAA